MPRQGRIQSGTEVYYVMMRGINRQRIFEDSEDHYTFLQCLRSAQEKFTPLGDRLPNPCHYYAYVEAPFENNVSCIEYVEERDRSMSDECVMFCLEDEFGMTDGQQIQKLSKEGRDVTL